MAVADQPSGLTDIASTLPQDEIPFKLRCAICNKLAVNAFRLPCCDQAVCENCQTSLPDTCPVCAHTPISADLCKPNKALRTTLKAFLRTEEKKREKERQQATPTTPVDTTPADATAKQETPQPTHTPQDSHVEEKEPAPTSDSLPVQPSVEQPAEPIAENAPDEQPEVPAEFQAQDEEAENDTSAALEKTDAAEQNDHGTTEEASTKPADSQPTTQQPPVTGQMPPNPMAMNMGGGFGNMSWNPAGDFNPMSQFMPNGMFNFQNPMGMPGMAMDPMAQGMFGGYGMNMNGMSNGMNMGTGFDAGQGMYGGWDGSQSNLWNGGQDKFNPTAFANGMGQQYGGPSGFGGFNLPQPQQFPNQNYQNAYYGPGARGNFRGRGRGGFFYGRGRGGFTGQSHANFAPDDNGPAFQDQNSFNQEAQSQSHEGPSAGPDGEAKCDGDVGEQEGTEGPGKETTANTNADEVSGEAKPAGMPSADSAPDESQLRGIPTIDSLDQTNQMGFAPTGPTGMAGNMGMGFGRGGYMHGGFAGGRGGFGPYMPGPNIPPPSGPGVEGAPAAPRAMRQGLPNTSVLRHRGYQPQAQGACPAGKPAEASQNATPGPQDPAASRAGSRSKSRSRSKARSPSRSRSRSPPSSWRRHRRHRSRSYDPSDDDRERRRERRRRHRREDDYDEQSADEYGGRTRSPSIESSRRSSRRRDRDRDRRSRRSHRSRRHRTRSPSRGGDHDRLSVVPEEDDASARDVPEQSTRSHRSRKDRSSRHDDRDREARRRDRERHERHRERHREREKKRSRRDRDRTESPGVDSDYTSHHRSSRRVRRSRGDHDGNHEDVDDKETEPAPEKDPHTLEREARNRERLLKEQQRRDAMHGERPSRKRDSRSERALHGTRRVSYKYEDEESDAARAERVESEREASRWA